MTRRVTVAELKGLVRILNKTAGNPAEVWSRGADGQNKAHVGAYVLDAAYGGYRLCRIVSESGGERDITPRCSARECADQIRAYMAGILSVTDKQP